MKKLYENQKHSLYYIAQKSGLNLRNLYRYANKQIDIKYITLDYIIKIAEVEHISPQILLRDINEYLKGDE